MSKKRILIIGIILFSVYLKNNYDKKKKRSIDEYRTEQKFKENLKKFGDFKWDLNEKKIQDFLNNDNLYENYKYNYAIKIPENYKKNNGIGEFTNIQFYNEETGFVVVIYVVPDKLKEITNTSEINNAVTEMNELIKKDKSLVDSFKTSFEARGFIEMKFKNSELINYNNRHFIRFNFDAKRISNNYSNPTIISIFMTFYSTNIYQFIFTSNGNSDTIKWDDFIQSTMNNAMISEYIIEKK